MGKLRFRIAMSLDGYVAGPDQSPKDPLGVGGTRLHEWVFPLKVFREHLGMEGGETNESSAVFQEQLANVGATIMGRNMFGGHPGPWDAAKPWDGWWGETPPFHHPVFVITHHARAPLAMKGDTTFHFVTGGIDEALARARDAAGAKDVLLGGGANVARQFLVRGLVDELDLNVAPVLLGRGERLFDGVGDDLHGLRLVKTVATPRVVHLKLAR